MTALSSPYTLLRRDGEARISRAEPPRRPMELAVAAARGAVMPGTERRHGLLRTEVARLITERNFAVAFQPVVRLADRRPVSHEALLRLRPPQGQGAPQPSTRLFVDAAQAWGLGTALDEAVLDVTLATWPRTAPTPVSVNIHARSLADPVFFARLLTRVAGEGATLAVEITGIDDGADLSAVVAIVPALRGVGMRVVLDDFAASATCLACVQATRFDEVKLSGAVVGAAVESGRGKKLLRALVALAEAAGARVVAKLVETMPQAVLMHDAGVAFGQGWLFGAPVLSAPAKRAA
jgi:EAL domain-containing protein (putative c-di-GMP-specific phosphodiesterase class I)